MSSHSNADEASPSMDLLLSILLSILATSMESRRIRTRMLVLSDTNGMASLPATSPKDPIDVVIHCGNMTQQSELKEFHNTIRMLSEIEAPTKLVIAGNHDFALDLPVLKRKIEELKRTTMGNGVRDDFVGNEFGSPGEALELFIQARDDGIILLGEGTHRIRLKNDAVLNLYASPYTPSNHGKCGFQYTDIHRFHIPAAMDVVVTHGPPLGLMDMTMEKQRIGCPWLFAAVARAQPRVHCFGHVNNGWGAELVSWRATLPYAPTYLNAVDDERSTVIESLSTLKGSDLETLEEKKAREKRLIELEERQCRHTSHCDDDEHAIKKRQSLLVNASIKGWPAMDHKPWLIDIELDPA